MNAPKRKIVLSKRPATLTFPEEEQPTTPYRSRPPEIRRSSGTRPAVGISDRPTARPPSSGVSPVVLPPPPPSSPPAQIEMEMPAPPSSGAVATWVLEEAPELGLVPTDEDTMTVPRARRGARARGWGGPVVIAMLVVACEIAIAHWPRVLAVLVGE